MTTSSPALLSRVDQALRQSPIPALRRLRVEETDQAIILSGSVSTYYLKQLAQETIMPLRGERQLHNRVSVRSQNSTA
jgi:osmotically-inducible protein OsmY